MQVWMLENGKLMGELSGKQRESVERIRRSIRSSLRLIDDLLEVSRAEAGQIDLKPVETDVGEAAREVADDFRAQAIAAGLEMNVRAPQRLQARTDPIRLRQILTNLLSNAVKYTPRGQVTVDAKAAPTGGPRAGDWVAVRVIDTGPGIPKDKWEAIFQEYTRLSPQTHEGAGIGLAISRRIAQLLGGDLTVESEVGRGSVFTLWLPAAPVHLQGDGAAQERNEAAVSSPR
jgi:signal transduction histidine kinase